jgi:DNA-binding transcriptional regulator YiaG
MKISIDAIRRQEPLAMKELLVAVTRSARSGCRKIGAESIEEDVAQEVFMLFITQLINKFNEDYNVEPLLIETSKRVAWGLLRKTKELHLSDDDLLKDLLDGINTDTSNSIKNDELPILEFEQRQALERIKKMSYPRIEHENKKEANVPNGISKFVAVRNATSKANFSPDGLRLREIQKMLGISQEEFAQQLDIKVSRLASYLGGRITKIKPYIMERAEDLLSGNADVITRNQQFVDKKMSEIAKGWMHEIGAIDNSLEVLSEILSVARSTVHRWLKDEIRPDPRELSRLDSIIKGVVLANRGMINLKIAGKHFAESNSQ